MNKNGFNITQLYNLHGLSLILSVLLTTNTACSMLRVGESKRSEKLNPTSQIPETVFGHKPIHSEAVTARSAKSHADSHQKRI